MIIDCGSFGASTRGPGDLDEAAVGQRIDAILASHNTQPNLVLSHGDKDHYSYLDAIMDNRQLGNIWQGGRQDQYPGSIQTLLNTQTTQQAIQAVTEELWTTRFNG